MTIIMGLTIGNAAALIGDSLITSPGSSDKKFSTPTLEDANAFFKPYNVHVPALRQKVNILREDVIVAWERDYERARSLLKEMSEALDAGCPSKYVVEILKAWPTDEKKHFSVIALIREPETTTVVWDGDEILHLNSNIFSSVIGTGSGKADIAGLMQRFEAGNLRVDDNAPDPLKLAMYSMVLGSQAAGLELMTQQNLPQLWGGCVETSLFNRGVATKVGEILYAFWECDKRELKLELLPTFLKQEYQGELMVAHTLSNRHAPRIIAIPPVLSNYADGERIEVEPPRLSYDWLCSCVLVRDGGLPVDIFSTVERCDQRRPVGFSRTQSILSGRYESSLKVEVSRSYIDEITKITGERVAYSSQQALA